MNENLTIEEQLLLANFILKISKIPWTFQCSYKNWKGKVSVRTLSSHCTIWYGSTEWHPEPGLLVNAWDLDKNNHRDFALKDFNLETLVKID